MTDENPDVVETDPSTPQYGVGPFTIREISLLGVWLVAFIVSFFSIYALRPGFADNGAVIPGLSVWTLGLDWILTIGVPTVAVFLVTLRRFSPQGIRRVGSLGIDQFASVAFSVSAAVWLGMLWEDIAAAIISGALSYSWVVWVEFFLMLAGVVLTVAAPFIPPFAEDFAGRPEVVAHRNASPVRAVTARPRPVTPAAPAPSPDAEVIAEAEPATFTDLGIDESAEVEDEEWSPPYARRGAESEQAVGAVPFWALAPVDRDVHDETGAPIFTVGPTAWALVIEDRGAVYVIQHEDGRIGYLHDVSGIRRG